MSESKAMQTTASGDLQRREDGESEVVLRPAVDIYEESDGITLKADLPGVTRERLDVQVDGKTLTIDAEAVIQMPEDMKALYADVHATRYRRSITLSNELEADNIRAQMNNGELTLHLPKRAELQPRKIEISGS